MLGFFYLAIVFYFYYDTFRYNTRGLLLEGILKDGNFL